MPFMIKCVGGPLAGERYCDRLEDYGLSWPLPEILPGTENLDGSYHKISESQLPPEAAKNPHVGVGAVFEWREDAADD